MLAEAAKPTDVSLKKPGIREWAVWAVFVVFSVGGQLIPKMAAGEQIPWNLLPMGIVPLIMTVSICTYSDQRGCAGMPLALYNVKHI